MTGVAMLPFGALAIGIVGYTGIQAILAGDLCSFLAMVMVAAWFAFITWSMTMFAFTGYHPAAFCHLWNLTWGWLFEPIPLPPPKPRNTQRSAFGPESKDQREQRH